MYRRLGKREEPPVHLVNDPIHVSAEDVPAPRDHVLVVVTSTNEITSALEDLNNRSPTMTTASGALRIFWRDLRHNRWTGMLRQFG